MYSYQETLNIVDKFMEKTGMRDFCSQVCKGQCCGRCYKNSSDSCVVDNQRKLSCSIFLCAWFPKVIFDKQFQKTYWKCHRHIEKIILKHVLSGNIYFRSYKKDFIDSLFFNENIIDSIYKTKLAKKNIQKAENILNFVTSRAKPLRRFKFKPIEKRGPRRFIKTKEFNRKKYIKEIINEQTNIS